MQNCFCLHGHGHGYGQGKGFSSVTFLTFLSIDFLSLSLSQIKIFLDLSLIFLISLSLRKEQYILHCGSNLNQRLTSQAFSPLFSLDLKSLSGNYHNHNHNHGCQNLDLNPMILQFYDLIYSKWSTSFKKFCDRSGSVGSYDSNDFKWPWFLVTFFNLTEDLVGSKRKMKSQ